MTEQRFTVYILLTSKNTFYIGQTKQLDIRIKEHKEKKGSKHMRAFPWFTLVHTETYKTRSEALRQEALLKKMTRLQKEEYVKTKKLPAAFFKNEHGDNPGSTDK